MSNYSELVQIIKELLNNRFLPQKPVARGLLGDGLGNVIVPGRPDFNYVRFNRASSERFEVFNKRVSQPVDGTPVLIGEDYLQPGLIQILSIDWSTYLQTDWGDAYASIQAHAPTHEWPTFAPGSDPVNVYPRSFTQLRTQSVGSGSNSVYVTPYEYDWTGTSTIWPGVPPVSFSAKPPTGSMLYMGVYLNPATNTLGVVSGSTTTYTDAVEPPIPNWPLGVFPSGYVRLYGGQAGITERDIRPAQRLYNSTLVYTGTSVGGGGSPSGPAGGDLTGTYPDPRVVGLNSIPILGTPAVNQFLMFTGSAWRPSTFTIPDQWPYDKILTVSPTNAFAGFTTIQSAINYQEANTLQDVIILCDPAVYTETLTFTLGSVCLASLGVNGEVVVTSTDAVTITINAQNVTLKNITIDNAETGTNGTCVQIAANRDGTIFDNCRFSVTNATVTNAYGADINGGDTMGTLFRECTFFLDAGATLNVAIDAAADCIVLIEDGQIEALGATNYAINSASGSIIQLNGPRFISGSINGAGSLISDRTLDVTINGPVTLTNSLNGKNPAEAVISSSQNTTDITLTPSGSDLQFANWTVRNTGAGGGGISHTALTNAQTGLVLDGCVIERITGSCTTSIAFSSSAGDTLARNCTFNSAGGLTVNYAVYLSAASTVIIEGGEITAGTVITAHASAVLKLQGPRLGSGVILDNSGGGTIEGWYVNDDGIIINLNPAIAINYEPLKTLSGLVGLWAMNSIDRSTGNLADLGGQGRTLTYNGNPTYNRLNSLVPYIDLDGTGDYLSRADENGLDITGAETLYASGVRGLTMGGWFRVDTVAGAGLMSKHNATGNQRAYLLFLFSGGTPANNISFQVSSTGADAIRNETGFVPTSGVWYYVVGRYIASTSLDVWVGRYTTGLTKYTFSTSIPAALFASTASFEIGGFGGGTNLLDGGAALCWLSANQQIDAVIENIFESQKWAFR